jgi:hypothetical protein
MTRYDIALKFLTGIDVKEKMDRRTGKQGQHESREDIDTHLRRRKRTGVHISGLYRRNY